MTNTLNTITIVVSPDLKKQYAMAKATGLLKSRDFQELMRQHIQSVIDSLILKSKSTNGIQHKEALYVNKNMEQNAGKEKTQGEDTDRVLTDAWEMFNG